MGSRQASPESVYLWPLSSLLFPPPPAPCPLPSYRGASPGALQLASPCYGSLVVMRNLRARLLAVLLLAVLLPAGAFARAQYHCRMMGRTVTACCCASKHKAKASACEVQIRSRDCCERVSGASERDLASSAREAAPPVFPAGLAATLPALALDVPVAASVALSSPQARAPPGLGPPLFLAHCAFLS